MKFCQNSFLSKCIFILAIFAFLGTSGAVGYLLEEKYEHSSALKKADECSAPSLVPTYSPEGINQVLNYIERAEGFIDLLAHADTTFISSDYEIMSKEFSFTDENHEISIIYPYMQHSVTDAETLAKINETLFQSSFCQKDFMESEDGVVIVNIQYRIIQAAESVLSVQFYGYWNTSRISIPLNYSITLNPSNGFIYPLSEFYSDQDIANMFDQRMFIPLRTEADFFSDKMFEMYKNYTLNSVDTHIYDYFINENIIGIVVSVPIGYGSELILCANIGDGPFVPAH